MMTTLPDALDPLDFALRVESDYACLIPWMTAELDGEPGLGGKLLYAGELDEAGRALVVAANIGGAATLAATADGAAQRQANREGVVDFLVTSLDEALRILKNQLRKHETVAVCVAASPEAVATEMVERGVRPEMLVGGRGQGSGNREQLSTAFERFLAQGARLLEQPREQGIQSMLVWSVATAPAQWLPRVDGLVAAMLPENAWAERRWLRLAPRYLGRSSQGVRLLRCKEEMAFRIIAELREQTEAGEIGVPLDVRLLESGRAN